MRFSYSYRTSDGERHVEEMDAESRDAVFAILRERGIRAIKVSPVSGKNDASRWRAMVTFMALVMVILAIAGGGMVWWQHSGQGKSQNETTSAGTRPAMPRPRHFLGVNIPVAAVFKEPTDRFLATFAEPGREARARWDDFYEGAFADVAARRVEIATTDPPPIAELKRILAGIKQEAVMLLRGGKSAKEVATWFADRQQMEVEWRKALAEHVASGKMTRTEADRMIASMGFEPLPH